MQTLASATGQDALRDLLASWTRKYLLLDSGSAKASFLWRVVCQ